MKAHTILLVFAVQLAGCASAVSKPVMFVTTRGVESSVAAAPDRVESRARIALQELGMDVSSTTVTEGGAARVVEGVISNVRVTVQLRVDGDETLTEVIARRNSVSVDRKLARQVLDRIATLS